MTSAIKYSVKGSKIFSDLKSDLHGLSRQEASARLEEYGSNSLKQKEIQSIYKIFFNQFNSFVVWFLVFAAVLSAWNGDVVDMTVILVVLFVNALIGTTQEHSAEKAIQALKKLSEYYATVYRDEEKIKLSSENLVPGDVIFLEAGDRVPADCLILESVNLRVNESILTGESVEINKNNKTPKSPKNIFELKNCLFRGTIVITGNCKAIIFSTGMNTEIGKTAKQLEEIDYGEIPLNLEIKKLMKKFTYVILASAILVLFLARIILTLPWNQVLKLAIAQAVSAVPEGLPITVTAVLAFGLLRMASRKALIRKLDAVQTIGSVDVICTDKTGTLTENKMTITEYYDNERLKKAIEKPNLLLLETGILCNTAFLDKKTGNVIGDGTETAIVRWGLENKISKEELDLKYKKIKEIPFDSQNKYMVTYHEFRNKTITCFKGALEVTLEKCSYYKQENLNKKLDENTIKTIKEEARKLNQKGLRVIGVARKEGQSEKIGGLTFLGFVAMYDPPKPGVKESIKQAKDLGVKTIMITGDSKITAYAIAKELGIASKEEEVFDGSNFDDITDEELKHLVLKTSVFSRTTSQNKVRIIEALQQNNLFVAMTGDGVNDALALKKGNVGISMGSGTEVAKDSSKTVILDDNFATIIAGIEEGRNIHRNIQKVVNFQLSGNVGHLLFLITSLLLAYPIPVLPIVILYMNLLTDGACTINLGLEKESTSSKKKTKEIVTKETLYFIIPVIIITTLIAMLTYTGFIAKYGFNNMDYIRTAVFAVIVLSHLFTAFAFRSLDKSVLEISLKNNYYLLIGISISLGLMFLAIYSPFMNQTLHTMPLSFTDFITVLGLSTALFFTIEILKLLPIKNNFTNPTQKTVI
ncbi:Potassium-transporting ATPase ATP-binding subunit [uncultured archaeon]|nr:Potassium-transporting ATPase ATP-binding subunit [uncultured archaeon]